MKTIKAVLDKEDVNIIFECLCESEIQEVADGELCDLFMILSRLETDVVIETDDPFNRAVREIVGEAVDIVSDDDCILSDDEIKSLDNLVITNNIPNVNPVE